MKLTEKKRKNIIAAAIEEFREHGFLGARTVQIAKRAGVSSRTLYNHFESKEALFDEISKIMLERNSTMKPVSYDPSRTIEEQLIDALTSYVGVITHDDAMGLNRLVISELLRDLERSRQFFAQTATHDYPVTNLIKAAMDTGVLQQDDPVYVTSHLLALVKSHFFWPVFLLGEIPVGKHSPDKVMADCVNLFLSYYRM